MPPRPLRHHRSPRCPPNLRWCPPAVKATPASRPSRRHRLRSVPPHRPEQPNRLPARLRRRLPLLLRLHPRWPSHLHRLHRLHQLPRPPRPRSSHRHLWPRRRQLLPPLHLLRRRLRLSSPLQSSLQAPHRRFLLPKHLRRLRPHPRALLIPSRPMKRRLLLVARPASRFLRLRVHLEVGLVSRFLLPPAVVARSLRAQVAADVPVVVAEAAAVSVAARARLALAAGLLQVEAAVVVVLPDAVDPTTVARQTEGDSGARQGVVAIAKNSLRWTCRRTPRKTRRFPRALLSSSGRQPHKTLVRN